MAYLVSTITRLFFLSLADMVVKFVIFVEDDGCRPDVMTFYPLLMIFLRTFFIASIG